MGAEVTRKKNDSLSSKWWCGRFTVKEKCSESVPCDSSNCSSDLNCVVRIPFRLIAYEGYSERLGTLREAGGTPAVRLTFRPLSAGSEGIEMGMAQAVSQASRLLPERHVFMLNV